MKLEGKIGRTHKAGVEGEEMGKGLDPNTVWMFEYTVKYFTSKGFPPRENVLYSLEKSATSKNQKGVWRGRTYASCIVLCTYLKSNETNMSLFHDFLDGRRAEGAVGWWMPQKDGRDVLEQLWGGQEERESWQEWKCGLNYLWLWLLIDCGLWYIFQ